MCDVNNLLSGTKEGISTGTPVSLCEKLILQIHAEPVHDHDEYGFFTGNKFYQMIKFCILMTSGFIHIKYVCMYVCIYIYIHTRHDFIHVFINIIFTIRLLVMNILFIYLSGYD